MSALGSVARVLADPEVRAIAVPLIKAIVSWLRGPRDPIPLWLAGVVRDVPALRAPVALAQARARARK